MYIQNIVKTRKLVLLKHLKAVIANKRQGLEKKKFIKSECTVMSQFTMTDLQELLSQPIACSPDFTSDDC